MGSRRNIYGFNCETVGEKTNIQSRRLAMVVGEYHRFYLPKNTLKTIYALPDIEGHIRKK